MDDHALQMLVRDYGADVEYIPTASPSGIYTRSGAIHGGVMQAMAIIHDNWPVIDKVIDELSKLSGFVGTGIAIVAHKKASRPTADPVEPPRMEMIVEGSSSLSAREKSDATARAARNGMSIRFK